jgi:anaerobic selenocysteine-containing dehydrogenase
MAEVRTFCRVCEPACGLVAAVEDGRLTKLRPDREHPISRGWACNKGIATFDIHRDPDRLSVPLRRDGDRFARTSWDEAMRDIAARMRAIKGDGDDWATAVYLGNPTAFNAFFTVGLAPFLGGLRTRQIYSAGTQDCSNKFAASEAVYGSSTVHPLPDFDHTDYLLVLGSNPAVSHMSFISIADPVAVLRAIEKRGGKVRFVNPRRIETVKLGIGELIQIRPDSDVYFLAALLHELEQIGAWDEALIAVHGKNADELHRFIGGFSAAAVESVTGIPAATIRRTAREWADARGASVTMSTGVNMGRHGTLAYWLVQMLSFVTGNLDRRGGNLQSVGYYPAAALSGRTDPARTYFDGRFGRVRHVRGSLPGNLLADEILTPGRGRVRSLFVIAGNPLLSMAGEARLREALRRLDLLVCIDLYRNATGEYADYLLPATDQFERADVTYAGLGLQHRPHAQYTPAVVAPAGERAEEWWILARLCKELGFKGPLDDSSPSPQARLARMLERGGISLEELEAAPGGITLAENQPGRLFSEFLPEPVDCFPALFAGALSDLTATGAGRAAAASAQLLLITKRDRFMHNSWFHNVEKMKRGEHHTNYLHMHPADARWRGLGDGETVRLRSASGEVRLPVRYDEDLLPGVVAATHGWGHAAAAGMRLAQARPGANVNALLASGPGSFDPLSNMAWMTGIPVEVEAVAD